MADTPKVCPTPEGLLFAIRIMELLDEPGYYPTCPVFTAPKGGGLIMVNERGCTTYQLIVSPRGRTKMLRITPNKPNSCGLGPSVDDLGSVNPHKLAQARALILKAQK